MAFMAQNTTNNQTLLGMKMVTGSKGVSSCGLRMMYVSSENHSQNVPTSDAANFGWIAIGH